MKKSFLYAMIVVIGMGLLLAVHLGIAIVFGWDALPKNYIPIPIIIVLFAFPSIGYVGLFYEDYKEWKAKRETASPSK